MTIQSGSRIDAQDYNDMQSKVANVLGTGSGNKGYGQTVLSTPVSATNAITAAQMQNLKTDLNKIKYHQTNAATVAPPVLSNTLIKASDWLVYNQESIDLEAARFNLSSSINQSTKVVNLQPTYTTWNGTQTHNVIVDFGSANAGRYFFNSGGEIILEPSHSSNTLDKGANWAALFASFVPVRIAYSTTTARAGTSTNIGWYGLTTNDQIVFTIAATGTYAGNNYTVKARCDVSNNSTGAARYLYLTIELSDIGANPGSDLNVDGVTTNKVSNNRATGSYVEVAAPIITDNYVTPAATYSLSANPASSSNEGATISFTLATSNLPSGSLVPYTISGTGINIADFGGASLTGNFTLDANGFGTVVYATAVDHLTEGNETFTLRLNNNGASISYVIIDSSLSYPTITTAPVIQMLPSTEVEGTLSIVSNTVWNPTNSGFAQFALWQSSADGTTFSDTSNFDLTYKTVTNDIGKYWRLRQASTNYETYAYSNVIGPVKLTQTYTLTASPLTQATEGTSVTITLTTFNVPNGLFPYTISGNGITASDFGLSTLTGNFDLVNSTASITLNLINDQNQSEVSEDFTISLNNGKANLIYRINDPISGYSFSSPPPASVDEGSTTTFTISTVNVYFTTLYWDIDYNSSSAAADFVATSGSFPLTANAGTFDVSIVNDLIKEGTESFRVRVRTGSITGPVVLTSNAININDTSTTVISTLTFAKSNYLIGQQGILNWTITGVEYDTIQVSILKPDNSTLSTSGSLAKAIRTFSSTAVFNVEGQHTAVVALYKGTTKMTQSQIVTSVGAAPTYSLTRNAANGSENIPFTITLTTTNVDADVLIPFTITRSVQTVALANDFSSWVLNGVPIAPSLTGNFLSRSGGSNPDIATLVVTPSDDRVTEASGEIFTVTLGSPGSGSISYTITDPNLTAAAFSFTPLIDQEPNIDVTSGNVTITGLEPNLSTSVTATGGLVDAGTTALSGTFAASKTLTSSPSGTILVAARVTTGALGQVAKSVTIAVNAKTNAAFTATTRLGDVDGNLSNPTNATNVELNSPITIEAVFTALEKSASITVTAASGFVSNNANTGFAASCTLTTDSNGSASIWYRLTSANAVSSTVTMGTLTVRTSGGSKTYAPNWSVTTRAADVTGTLNNPVVQTNQNLNGVVTSAATTITGLQVSYTFTLSIDSGLISTNATSGFASSISVTSNSTGTITFYFRVTTPNSYNTPISVGTLTLTGGGQSEIYPTNWSVTTKAFKILGTLSSPANVTNSALNTVQTSVATAISGLEVSYTYTLDAASGLISTSAASGFASSIQATTNASGSLTFYYRLTSSSDFGGSVSMGQLTLGGNGQTQTYNPTWTVTNIIFDVVGTYSGPTSLITYDLNTVKTSTAATINALQLNNTFTLSTASGLISADPNSGFASSISITSNSTGAITFYYRLTTASSIGGVVSMGTLTLSGFGQTQTYAPSWSVTTRAVDMTGTLSFNPTSRTNAIRNTTYKTTIDYTGLEANYNFTLTPLFGDVSLDDVGYGTAINFTTSGTGSIRFYYALMSASTFNQTVNPGTFTLSAVGQTPVVINPVGWSITTATANINGAISAPTNITGAVLSTAYPVSVSLTGFEASVTFTITHAGSTGTIGTSSSSFATSISVSTDGTGSAIIWYQLTSSGSYSASVSMPALTITGGGATRSYTPTWSVTTAVNPANIYIPPPTNVGDAFLNTWYSRAVDITGAVPGTIYTLSIVATPGITSPGQLSNDNSTWGASTSFTINGSGKGTVYYRLYSGNDSPVTVSMPALLLTVNGATKQFTTGWTISTRTNYSSPALSITWGGSGTQQNASPGSVYTSGTFTASGLAPNSSYTVVGTAYYPSGTYKPQIDESYVMIDAGTGYAREITAYTDSGGRFSFTCRVKALPTSGTISAYPVVINPISGRWASYSIYSVRVP